MAANPEALIARPLETAGALIVASFRKHPVRNTSVLASYLVGLGVALFFSGLATTGEQMQRFEARRPSTAAAEELFAAQRAAAQAQAAYHASRGWFWSCDAYCSSQRLGYESRAREVARLQSAYDAQMREAKSQLGVFSVYGVAEARELFASLYGWGKGMAGRMSFYDLLFSGFRMSRDDTVVEWAVRMLSQVMMNIFISGCAVVVSFSTGVTSVIASFAPSWPEAVAFWVLAVLAVLATALTACVGCCCCVVGVPVAVAQLAPPGTFRVRRIGADGNLRDYANGGGGRFMPPGGFRRAD